MGVAERYKFFLKLNIQKGPHVGGYKRPKFLSPLFNLKARTWVLQKGTSSFKTLIYRKVRTRVGLKGLSFFLSSTAKLQLRSRLQSVKVRKTLN